MPPRLPFPTGLRLTSPFIRLNSTTAGPPNRTSSLLHPHPPTATATNPLPARTRENTASSLLNLDRDRGAPRRPANSGANPRSRSSTEEIQRLIARTDERYSRIRNQRADVQKRMEAQRLGDEYMLHMARRWREGDVFTPHDLSANEMRKWRKRLGRKEDVLEIVGVNPLDHYRVGFPVSPIPFLCVAGWDIRREGELTGTAEPHPHLGLHQLHGPRPALQRHGPQPPEPAQGRKDGPPRHGHGHPPQRPPPPRAHPDGVAGQEVARLRCCFAEDKAGGVGLEEFSLGEESEFVDVDVSCFVYCTTTEYHVQIPQPSFPSMIQTPPKFTFPYIPLGGPYARSTLEIRKLIPVSSVPRRPFFSSAAHSSGYSPSAHAWKSAWSLRPGSALYIMPRLSQYRQ